MWSRGAEFRGFSFQFSVSSGGRIICLGDAWSKKKRIAEAMRFTGAE